MPRLNSFETFIAAYPMSDKQIIDTMRHMRAQFSKHSVNLKDANETLIEEHTFRAFEARLTQTRFSTH